MEVEACIRVVDKINPNYRKNFGCTKRGDVIEILPGGTDWGKDIMAGADWRIVKLDIPVTLIESLMTSERGTFADRDARKRKYGLSLDSMPAPFAQRIIDNVTTITDLSTVNIAALTALKPAI